MLPKFRAWHKELKIMDQVTELDLCCQVVSANAEEDFRWNLDEAILMQWTGFQDCDGRDIYEGDIVGYTSTTFMVEPANIKVPIVFENGMFCAVYGGDHLQALQAVLKYGAPGDLKIIGNIYENPELLERK